ncbi:MAG: cytochrome b [Hyphomicrobiaceae bacterium]|nr:cytochrome b [Hyphomicrobiaceae bacterium]
MSEDQRQELEERYSVAARVLHWAMALGFIFMWACGYAMTSLVPEDSALEKFLFGLHISIGVTLLGLLIIRIAVRSKAPPPPLPQGFAPWEKAASHLGHLALYVLPAVIIVLGWAETNFSGYSVRWFGVHMPKIFPSMENLWGFDPGKITEELHAWLAYTMLAVAIVHIAAVIKHRWFDGHDVLHRMTFGKAGPKN